VSALENQDPLILATNLIIQRIDESLARGNKEDADKAKAKAILLKINSSAEHAVSCVLESVNFGGLNEPQYQQ
jgi:hypothetical protein